MKSRLVFVGILSLGQLVTGCDKTPPATIQTPTQKKADQETPEKKMADLFSRVKGDATSPNTLGKMYDRGEGVTKDTTKAFEQYQKAVAQGNAEGQDRVAAIALPSAPPTEVAPTIQYGSSKSLALGSACTTSQQCAGDNLCIGSPLSCQPRFGYGHACSNSNECEGSLSCDAGQCISPPVPLAAARKPSVRKSSTPLVKVDPVYPREAIRSGIERGQVVAQLFIDEKGVVTDVKIVEADPPGVFNGEVTQALSQWKFQAEGEKFVGEVELSFVLK